jgi:hypothetical protein
MDTPQLIYEKISRNLSSAFIIHPRSFEAFAPRILLEELQSSSHDQPGLSRFSWISCSASETFPMACAALVKLCTGSNCTQSSLRIASSLDRPQSVNWTVCSYFPYTTSPMPHRPSGRSRKRCTRSWEEDCSSSSRILGAKASKLRGWIMNALGSDDGLCPKDSTRGAAVFFP